METKRLARFVIEKQAMNFSIAHFTIFSATERENLHGHNFQVRCELVAPVGKDGLAFNYGIIKKLVRALCDKINEKLILPEHSPYLILDDQDDYLVAEFNGEKLPFLKRDVLTLPIANTTVEELSRYFLAQLLAEPILQGRGITELTIAVSSSPGQLGYAHWYEDKQEF